MFQKPLSTFIEENLMVGKKYFTSSELSEYYEENLESARQAVYRHKKRGEITSPTRGLYIIITSEHRRFGCIPDYELLPIVMKYRRSNYYVGLLSAAMYYGASHQKPRVTQVIANKRIKNIDCGGVHISFAYKQKMALENFIEVRAVDTGYLRISSPELTAMDLFLYQHLFSVNHIATVLFEMIEHIKINKLISLARHYPSTFWLQRMGYILERLETVVEDHKTKVVESIASFLKNKKMTYIPLSPKREKKGYPFHAKWRIIENIKVESDL